MDLEPALCAVCDKPMQSIKRWQTGGMPVYHSTCARRAGKSSGPQQYWKAQADERNRRNLRRRARRSEAKEPDSE